MAGRPVAARGGGLTGLHYGLFVFVGLTLASIVWAIIMTTQVKDAEDARDRAQKQIASYGSPPAYYADEANARNTNVFAVMDEDRARFAKLVTGSDDAVGKTAEADARAVVAAIAAAHKDAVSADAALVPALNALNRALTAEKERAAKLESDLAAAQTENKSLAEGLAKIQDDYKAQVAALTERVEASQKEAVETLAKKDEQLSDLQGTLENTTQELSNFRKETQLRERERDLELARLQNQNEATQRELRGLKRSGFEIEEILTKADGRVLRAIPGSDVVYINLGERDGIRVGMGFAVFSATGEVRDLRGKASLEVVTVMNESAECRINRTTPGQPIIEGDLVVNIAYEKSRKPRFLLVGDYDLNFDGVPDFDGMEKMRAFVRQWGGQVVDKLDESTDFVVIGAAPVVPKFDPGEPPTAVVRALADEKSRELTKFRDLIAQAHGMFIPVINQNQFLFLTGFAGDTTIQAP